MQSVPVNAPKSSNDQGISMKDKKILDIDIHIAVYYEGNQLTEKELQQYKIDIFCNSKRPQNTTLEQIFKEFEALIVKTEAFAGCKFNEFTIISKLPRSVPVQKQDDYNEANEKRKIESFFENLDQPAIYEVQIMANLYD